MAGVSDQSADLSRLQLEPLAVRHGELVSHRGVVTLYSQKIGDEPLATLGAASFTPTLESLNLGRNGLSAAGVRTLAAIVLPKLRSLLLHGASASGVSACGTGIGPVVSVSKALVTATIDRLEKRLESEKPDEQSILRYHALFAARSDAVAELVHLSRSTTNDLAAGAALVVGILRAAEKGETLDARLDDLFGHDKQVAESWELGASWDGLDASVAALSAFGPERGRKIVARLLSTETRFPFACLFLHLFPEDQALHEAMLERLARWKFPSGEVAMGLSLFAPEELSWLVAALPRLGGEGFGLTLARLGLQGALMRAARRGASWDPTLDSLLDVHDVWSDSDTMFASYAARVIRTAVDGLASERRMAWFAAQSAPLRPAFTRLILATPPGDGALVERLLRLLADSAKAVRKPAFDWLTELARDLGPSAATYLPILAKTKKLLQAFEAGTSSEPASRRRDTAEAPARTSKQSAEKRAPKKAAAITKLETLANRAREADAGTSTTVYALEALATRTPTGASRIGGPGFELGDRRPSSNGLPMTHVLTLALDDVPALGSLFPAARAFALYVSEPGGNEAWDADTDETAVVALTDEDVARGLAAASSEDLPLAAVRATRVEVPASTFDTPSAHPSLYRALVTLPARAGGEPAWLQGDTAAGVLALQFDQRFAPLSLGDHGVMYVFAECAFWQSA